MEASEQASSTKVPASLLAPSSLTLDTDLLSDFDELVGELLVNLGHFPRDLIALDQRQVERCAGRPLSADQSLQMVERAERERAMIIA